MPIPDILFLVGITSAFTIFAMVLAWGQFQTRSGHRDQRDGQEVAPGVVIRLQQQIARDVGQKVSVIAGDNATPNVANWIPPKSNVTTSRLG